MRLELLTGDIPKLFPFLETLLQDGGKKLYSINGEVTAFRYLNGRSGYRYHEGELKGDLGVGILLGGAGFVLRRALENGSEEGERFDYFNIHGDFTFTSDTKALEPLYVDTLDMDLSCPILNHLYNYLSFEYNLASEGKSKTEQVHVVEKFLRAVYNSKLIRLEIKNKSNDSAVTNIYNKMLQTELDPVLTWEERQLVFQAYRDTLKKILSTKIRAHKLSRASFKTALMGKEISNFFQRVIARPNSNFQGILYRYTIGKIIWFFQTVKNNLGYSIALAVYGPFTYYFITMPMNPHAMQAVGSVRSVYLETKTAIADAWDGKLGAAVTNTTTLTQEATAETKPQAVRVVDKVSTKAAAIDNSHIIYESEATAGGKRESTLNLDGRNESFKASLLNMLLSTDVEKVNRQNWVERMSNFKQMQIAYEENIEFASRMGRLEQLETQYNFPMQVEATWEELERYNTMIFKLRSENPNLSAKMKQFLFNETNRTHQLQLYLWDRLARFILDQPYVMLDQDKEQKRNDYYVGRAFVFMQEMTNILSWRYKDFKKPEGFEKIEKLAKFYEGSRKEFGSVTRNLKENSDLFKQKDVYDTKEFRAYMKRQWEILYLQNAKAEEASNMGLNMYIWSVRNTAWILQSIYSAKREELALLLQRDVTGKLFSPAELLVRSKVSMLYETLFHNLTLEYTGIREELKNRLGKDIESAQRMMVIENLKEFLSDREKLDGVNIANNKKTAESTL